ncbi:MAG TPA: cytochrome c peroxidase [Blastocatellia bacterium]|nr:cytochrome c peroxidase [Blastocatellia bacterium]
MRVHWTISSALACIVAVTLWHHFSTGSPLAGWHVPVLAATIASEPIQPIAEDLVLDQRKVRLGESLFNDPALSGNNSVSCATCHSLTGGGGDGRSSSIGIHGTSGPINAPTVFNSGGNFRQFWDGRAESLEDQIDGPVQAAGEMGSKWPDVIGKLSKSLNYVGAFGALYPDGIQVRNIKDAIATFERSLTTPNSRFDRYLRGDQNALTADEIQGYQIFKSYGCVSCHQGIGVGGNMFQTFGVMADYFADRGHITKADFGRFNVTGDPADRYVFKVPSLRNVELTAPYFHDGSVNTLEGAVQVMGKYQLGRHLSGEETAALVKFLKTLTGEYKGRHL